MQVGRASSADHLSASAVVVSREASAAERELMQVGRASSADHLSASAVVVSREASAAERELMQVGRASSADHLSGDETGMALPVFGCTYGSVRCAGS